MKYNLRWQILLAVMAFGLVLALLSFQVQTETTAVSYTSLCTTPIPAAGGIFTEGAVGAPLYLNPLLSDNQPLDRDLVSLIFDGLTRTDENGRLQPDLAQSWQVSEDGLTVRFTLREDVVWHDGQPVTASDVAFTYGLMQDDAFPGAADLKTLWQSVTINLIDQNTIEFVLSEPYSPFLEATTRGILPAHLLQGVAGATLAGHPFNQSPIGTGPFMVEPGQAWRQNGRLRLIPNPKQWPQGTQLDALEFRFYPDEATLTAAFTNGDIQAINRVTATMLPEVASAPQARLFVAPLPRYTALFFNVSESGGTAVRDLSVRQALAYGLNRAQLIDETLNGQALPLEGPYLPNSWAYNATPLTMYSYQPVTATTLLDAAGWPALAGVRQNEEETLSLRLLTLANPTYEAIASNLMAQWAALGIEVELLTAVDLSQLRTILNERAYDVALVEINPPGDPDLYDFWSQEAMISGQNYAGWNNRRASEALEAARQTWPVAERRPFYDTFLRLYDTDLPALTLFQHVYTFAVNGSVNGVTIGRIDSPRDRYQTFADWFMLYQDVTVACPAESADS
jgi:peptide/nickel transport system substrate-binding protein